MLSQTVTRVKPPRGLYTLPANTLYVVIDGAAVAISTLTGKKIGSRFFVDGEAGGYFVQTRQETRQETAARIEAERASRPAKNTPRPSIASILSDWD